MTKRSVTTYQIIPMVQRFAGISPVDLEEVMEWLADKKYLSELGIEFRREFWKLFIKERV